MIVFLADSISKTISLENNYFGDIYSLILPDGDVCEFLWTDSDALGC